MSIILRMIPKLTFHQLAKIALHFDLRTRQIQFFFLHPQFQMHVTSLPAFFKWSTIRINIGKRKGN